MRGALFAPLVLKKRNSDLAPAVLLGHVDVDLDRLPLLQGEVEFLGRLLLLLRDLLLHPDP